MSELSHLDERGRAAHGRRRRQGRDRARGARRGARSSWPPRRWRSSWTRPRPRATCSPSARLAGIMAAKRTHELIPLCHQLNLTTVARRHRGRTSALPGLRIVDRGAAARPHRRRDGGAGRRVGGRAHRLRHVQGRRPRHGGHGRAPAREERRPQRALAARRRATDEPAGGAAGEREHTVDGRIVSVNVAAEKGVRKEPVESITLVVEHGVEGDAHAGPWHRQVSLLANESIEKMLAAVPDVDPGAFGENVTTEGLVLYELPVGTRFYAGETPARGHPDRQGVPRPLRHLPPGRRLRDAARGHLRARPRGRRDRARQRHRAAQAEPHRAPPCSR